MNNQFFQTLLTKRGRFLNGENPSPAKLSAINAQTENAFSVIESFLGNGTDYLITVNGNRKLLTNLSSAIGPGSKIYKPVNQFHSLEQVAIKYLASPGSYNSSTGELTLAASTTITVHVPNNARIGIYYKTTLSNIVTVTYNTTVTQTFPSSTSAYTWGYVLPMATTESFTITCTGGLKLKAFVLYNDAPSMSPIQNNEILNIAYSIPITNNVFYSVKTPCKWASADRTGIDSNSDWRCQQRTCNYCIGNSYDLTTPGASGFGSPVCIGAISTSGSHSLSYTADSTTYKTIQSPALTVDLPYTSKFKGFKVYDNTIYSAGLQLPSNLLSLYDINNNSIPVIQNLDFFAGASDRGDIIFIKDSIGVVNNNKQYFLIGGSYGISDMIIDMLGLTKGY